MPKPSIKLSIKEERLRRRLLEAASEVPLKTKIAFMDALARKPQGLLVEEAAKALGISGDAGWGILAKPPTWIQKAKLEASEVPLATRQAFLDAMKEGKTIGEAKALTGVTDTVALVLLKAAMKARKVYTMDWVAK